MISNGELGSGLNEVVAPLQDLWQSAVNFVPTLIAALVVFLVGLILATGLGMVVERVLDKVKLDEVLKKLEVEKYFTRAGLRLHSSRFFGQLVFWFITAAFLLAASDILNLTGVSEFLREILRFIPNVVVAVIILLVAVLVANFTRHTVRAAAKSARMPSAKFLGTLSWWSIVIFGLLAALEQLGIAAALIQTLVTGIIAMFALAGGLAFGLGGKEYAAHLIEKMREHTGH
ncbi:hypothetical protein D6833_01910 [Candidatus Parcubacteria bacterium]|nr:MAG: hypothetical protein D6833_01910 [Candidatus Parcubacteria bacterium]